MPQSGLPVALLQSRTRFDLIKLKGCDSKQQADQLKFQPVFLEKSLFKSQKGSEIYLAELIDFSVSILGQEGEGRVLYFESDGKTQDFLVVAFSAMEETLNTSHLKSSSINLKKEKLKDKFLSSEVTDTSSETQQRKKELKDKSLSPDLFNKTAGSYQKKSDLNREDNLKITQKDHIYRIPFVSAYIQKIDFQNKKLILDLPENFLSLFK